ncbi:hypothetical protein [Polaribacter gochangensis]|uniref:hypothetical protein n=1 Tax=Polaribacter gochangensis TaxID=3252903 RepID=UPI003904942B
MKKIVVFLLFCTYSQVLFSQEKESIPTKFTQNGFANLDYISVKMPNDEDGNPEINMGLTGIHYNLLINKSLYAGLGFYGSVNGQRGGLFTLGMNLGIKKNISKNLFIDAGFHFGGGGGASAPDGGGAFILPHLNFGYQFKKISTTLGYSAINFIDKGNITSNQFRVGIQIPLSYDYVPFKNKEHSFSTEKLKNTKWNQFSKRISLQFHVDNLSPYGDSQLTDYTSLKGKTIRLAGFEITSYFSNNWFAYFRADGAFHGIQGGYMDLFIGTGYQFSMNKNSTNILTKFAIGAGGGGGVDSGGGILIYPDISLEQKVYKNIYLSISKGYLLNPNQHFTSSTLSFGVKYYANQQGIKQKNNTYFNSSKFKGIEVSIGQELYLNAQRMLQPTENLHQIAMQINVFLNKNVYLAGHTSFANFGNAGAYAEGIVGIGYQTNSLLNNKVQVFTQLLAGAAGGGDISTGQGLIIKPSIGFNYQLNNKLSFKTSIGRVKANGGRLNSTSLNVGVNYRFSILTAN